MASRTLTKTTVKQPTGVASRQHKALLDPATVGLAKAIYDAGKAGIDLSARLYELTKGEATLVSAVHESLTINDRFRPRLRLSSLCQHGIVVNKISMAALKDVPVEVFLMRPAASGLGDHSKSTHLSPPIPGKIGLPMSSPFVVPPMATQEIVLEVERAPILTRIYNKRGATLAVDYHVLGDDGDSRDLKIPILFRDDQPQMAGYPISGH